MIPKNASFNSQKKSTQSVCGQSDANVGTSIHAFTTHLAVEFEQAKKTPAIKQLAAELMS